MIQNLARSRPFYKTLVIAASLLATAESTLWLRCQVKTQKTEVESTAPAAGWMPSFIGLALVESNLPNKPQQSRRLIGGGQKKRREPQSIIFLEQTKRQLAPKLHVPSL